MLGFARCFANTGPVTVDANYFAKQARHVRERLEARLNAFISIRQSHSRARHTHINKHMFPFTVSILHLRLTIYEKGFAGKVQVWKTAMLFLAFGAIEWLDCYR